MRKRRSDPIASVRESAGLIAALREAMLKRTKAELAGVLIELAQADLATLRQLAAQFDVTSPPEELAAATRRAILDATAFDAREMNRNFDYDHQAYSDIRRNFSRLIRARQLPLAMELSLELMKQGSHQVEMSDEGLMTQEIQDCLDVVIVALGKGEIPADTGIRWCSAMLKNDRVGFIATEQLEALRHQLKAFATPTSGAEASLGPITKKGRTSFDLRP